METFDDLFKYHYSSMDRERYREILSRQRAMERAGMPIRYSREQDYYDPFAQSQLTTPPKQSNPKQPNPQSNIILLIEESLL